VFTEKLVAAFAIPFILLLCGAVAKKLVRGSPWQRSDFFLGVELTLSAMSAALVYGFDLGRQIARPALFVTTPTQPLPDLGARLNATMFFLTICLLLLWVVSVHQDWDRRGDDKSGQTKWLLIAANFVGISLLAAFVFLIQGT
jgi:hypothetical protein